MKLLYIFILLFSASICYSQSQGNTSFESQTFEDWTNSDGSLTNLSIEPILPFYYLKKSCDGTNTVNGEMAIKNSTYFDDNYMNGNGAAMISFVVKNDNAFNLYLRLGFTDSEGTKIVQTNPVVVSPESGVWQSIYISTRSDSWTLVEGPNTIEDVLFQTDEMWIIHNEDISFIGAYVNGNLEVDDFGTIYLGIDDFKNEVFIVYPIPTKDKIYIKPSSSIIERIEVYDLLGRKKNISQNNLKEIDVSTLTTGIYLLKIVSDSGIQTKKIIKN